jgi:hypothetical protein
MLTEWRISTHAERNNTVAFKLELHLNRRKVLKCVVFTDKVHCILNVLVYL